MGVGTEVDACMGPEAAVVARHHIFLSLCCRTSVASAALCCAASAVRRLLCCAMPCSRPRHCPAQAQTRFELSVSSLPLRCAAPCHLVQASRSSYYLSSTCLWPTSGCTLCSACRAGAGAQASLGCQALQKERSGSNGCT